MNQLATITQPVAPVAQPVRTPRGGVLMNANRQWESRPADERFGSLADMHSAVVAFQNRSAEAEVSMGSVSIVPTDGDDLAIVGPTGKQAALTSWSFGQMCERAKAPASYLRTLPTTLAAECLNNGLGENYADDDKALILFDKGDKLSARAITSDKYSRIWNADLTRRLIEIETQGPWQPAPAAFDGSRGLYLGDRDCFAFLVDNERRIFESGPGGGLSRGFFAWNSEVGGGSIGVMTFLYEYVCGNHRVWGASEINEVRIAHIHTDEATAYSRLAVELKRYAESSAEDDEAKVASAQKFTIGANKDEVLDALFGLRVPQLSRTMIGKAYELAEQRVDWYGAPNSAWGMAGGLTEIARDLPNANERVALDRAAARVMEMAF